MSHEPPVPPDNQSPYPIAEPPHEHPAPLPPVVEKSEGTPKAVLIGGAIAAVAATVLAGLAAVLLGRGKAEAKPSGPRPAARKAPAGGRGKTRTRRGDA